MAIRYYPAIVEQSGSNLSAFFPDVPGCVTAGDTMEEVAANAEAALAFHIRGMTEDGDTIPMPTPMEDLEVDPQVVEYARILVRAETSEKAVRINVTMDESLLAATDAAALRLNMSRSAFMAKTLQERVRSRLSSDEVLEILQGAFAPHKCHARLWDYDFRVKFAVFNEKNELMYEVKELLLHQLEKPSVLDRVIENARRELRKAGIILRAPEASSAVS